MTHPQGPWGFQDQPQRSKSGQWPNSWKSASCLPKQLEHSSHSLAYEITHAYKSWQGLSRWFSGKESVCNAGNPGLIPGSGRSPGTRNGNPLQYSCLKNPMDRGTWWATDHGIAKELDTTEHTCLKTDNPIPSGLSCLLRCPTLLSVECVSL